MQHDFQGVAFLGLGLIAAPLVVRRGLLMPVKYRPPLVIIPGCML